MNKDGVSRQILSDIVIYMKYAKYLPDKKRRETWEEIVDRNKEMHIKKFPYLQQEIEEAYVYVYEKKILPSMRSAQFAGKAIELNNSRIFNCSFIPISSVEAFSEIFFLLLSGCGVGFSVQQSHIKQLPEIIQPKRKKRFLIDDSLTGWATALKVLIAAYTKPRKELPIFDYRDIRPEGSPLKTAGGKAPGPNGLKDCLDSINKILSNKQDGENLTSIECHDIICFIAEAVVSGGHRRSSLISLFSYGDEDMLLAKSGEWWITNPQRAMANNSVVLLRHKVKEKDFKQLWNIISKNGSGEPGWMFSNDQEYGLNPCGEVSLHGSKGPTGTGGQMCNLVTINAADVNTQEEFNNRAKIAAFIATMQATYTDFHFLRSEWKEMTDKEALIGVSLSGIAAGNVMNLDIEQASKEVVKENERVSKLLKIQKAARCTVVKPEGTSALVLGISSGIHAYHAPYYLRRIRIKNTEALAVYLKIYYPELIEVDSMNALTTSIITIPVKAPSNAIFRNEDELELLNRVKEIYTKWILPGHRKGHNTNNVSCTVSVRDWEKVGRWMWDNRDSYAAISVLPYDNHTYVQAPFEEITKEKYEELVKTLKQIDLTKVVEMEDTTDLKGEAACAGGACEIR